MCMGETSLVEEYEEAQGWGLAEERVAAPS
jgi:hypothetical protein